MTAPFYRIDKFVVPDEARQAFIDAVDETDAVMRAQPGFVRHELLEQVGGPGEFNFVTVAAWESDLVIPEVAAVIGRRHARSCCERSSRSPDTAARTW